MPSSNSVALDNLERRLMDLEIRITHQEDTLETLNDVIVRQQQTIERLGDELQHARRRLNELDATPSGTEQAEPPPPHY